MGAVCGLHVAPFRYRRYRRNFPPQRGERIRRERRVGFTPAPVDDIAGMEGGRNQEAHTCHPAPLSSSRTAGDNDGVRRCARDLPSTPCWRRNIRGRTTSKSSSSCPSPSPRVLSPRPSFPTIPTSSRFHSVVTWRWWCSIWAASLSLAVMTWRRSRASFSGDVAGFWALLGGVVWR